MKTNLKLDMPIGEIAQGIMSASGTGNYRGVMVARVALVASNTATAASNWINPESGTIAAKVLLVVTTAGTGTIDIGIGSDGTGNSASILDGNTLAVGIYHRVGTNGTLGVTADGWNLVGPGGTGTNNSIIATQTTIEPVAGALVIQYFLIGA